MGEELEAWAVAVVFLSSWPRFIYLFIYLLLLLLLSWCCTKDDRYTILICK